jgi:hypothetical protein
MYGFLGFFVFGTRGVRLFSAIVFWILAVLYVVMFFIAGATSLPVFQKNDPPQFQTSADEYFGEGGGNAAAKDGQKPDTEAGGTGETFVA